MIATKSPSPSPFSKTDPSKPEFRKPLHPKNTFTTTTPSQNPPKKCTQQNNTAQSNKENVCSVLSSSAAVEVVIDPSLAEELNAVKLRLERLRLDRENTAKMLEDRHRMLDFRMYELRERGEFQRELEIEVDRLFRLKQLRVACMGTSPIRSLREKALDKRNSQVRFESAKSEDNEEKLENKSNNTTSESSSNMSTLESSWASTSTTTSAASPSTSSSTATSKLSTMIESRLSSDSASDKQCTI